MREILEALRLARELSQLADGIAADGLPSTAAAMRREAMRQRAAAVARLAGEPLPAIEEEHQQ